jgi:aspartate carbamoyltransferase catalytic subunit
VLNAGDGTHEHPTQALLDAFTMRRHLVGGTGPGGPAGDIGGPATGADLAGVRIAIVGDVLHSRVARSNTLLLSTLGASVVLVAPPTLLPVGISAWPCASSYDLDAVIGGELGPIDAIMMLRVQRERMSAAYFPSAREYSRRYGLDARRLRALPPEALVMHPGPMNRGLEISADAADSARSTIVEQVANGVAMRMAVLYHLLSGKDA